MWFPSAALVFASASEPTCAAVADVRHRRDPRAEELALARRVERSWEDLAASTVACLHEPGPDGRCAAEVLAWREAWTGCPIAQARVDAAPMWFGGLIAERMRSTSAYFDDVANSPHRPYVFMIVRAAQVELDLARWDRLEAIERGDASAADEVVSAHLARVVWWGKAGRAWYPRAAGVDGLLWARAQAEAELGRVEDARATLLLLVEGHAESPHLSAAWRLLAQLGPTLEAPAALRHAVEVSRHPHRGFALFELARALYDLEDFDAAMGALKGVIGLESPGVAPHVGLDDVALVELGRLYEAWEIDDEVCTIASTGESVGRVRRMLIGLGWLYRKCGHLDQAVETWRRVIATQPLHPDNPRWQELVVAGGEARLGDPEAAARELARLRSDFGAASGWWATNLDPAVRARTAEIIARAGERTLDEVAERALAYAQRAAADQDRVDIALHAQLGAVRHCVNRERPLLPELAGGLGLSFRVDLDGQAVDIAVAQDMPGGAHVAACVRRATEGMVFDPLQGEEPVDVSFPMVLAPGAEVYPRPPIAR